MTFKTFIVNDEEYELEITELSDSKVKLFLNGKEYEFEKHDLSKSKLSLISSGIKSDFFYSKVSSSDVIFNRGKRFTIGEKGISAAGSSKEGTGTLTTPMPGKITKVLKNEGDSVKIGDVIILMEAMKMEHSLKAKIDGKVKSIKVQEGDIVESGIIVTEIDPSA